MEATVNFENYGRYYYKNRGPNRTCHCCRKIGHSTKFCRFRIADESSGRVCKPVQNYSNHQKNLRHVPSQLIEENDCKTGATKLTIKILCSWTTTLQLVLNKTLATFTHLVQIWFPLDRLLLHSRVIRQKSLLLTREQRIIF